MTKFLRGELNDAGSVPGVPRRENEEIRMSICLASGGKWAIGLGCCGSAGVMFGRREEISVLEVSGGMRRGDIFAV